MKKYLSRKIFNFKTVLFLVFLFGIPLFIASIAQASHAPIPTTIEAWTWISPSQIQLKVHGPGPGEGQEGRLEVYPAVAPGSNEPDLYSVMPGGMQGTGCWFLDPPLTGYCSYNWSPPNGPGTYWFRAVAISQVDNAVRESGYYASGCQAKNVTLSWYNTIDVYAHTCAASWSYGQPTPPPTSGGNPVITWTGTAKPGEWYNCDDCISYNITDNSGLYCYGNVWDNPDPGCPYRIPSGTKTFDVGPNPGTVQHPNTKTFYIQAKDDQGHTNTVEGTFLRDRNPPGPASVSINNNATYANNLQVTLAITCIDNESGCAYMQFSNDGTNFSPLEAFITNKSWTFSPGDGPRTVYARFKDQALNQSANFSDSVIMDTASPSITYSPAISRDLVNNVTTFRLTASDPLPSSGLDGNMVSPANSPNDTKGSFGVFYKLPGTQSWVALRNYKFQNNGTGPFVAVDQNTPNPIGYNTQTNVVFEIQIPVQVGGLYVDTYCARIADFAGNTSATWSCTQGGGGSEVINTSWVQVLDGNAHSNYGIDALPAPAGASQAYNFNKRLSISGVNRTWNCGPSNCAGNPGSTIMENYSSVTTPANSYGLKTVPYPSYSSLYSSLYTNAQGGVVKVEKLSNVTVDQAFLSAVSSPSTVYHVSGNVTVTGSINFTGSGSSRKSLTIFVDGLLTFNSPTLTVGGENTLVWASKGGVSISKNVTSLDGAIISEGVINTSLETDGLTTTPALVIKGLLASIPLNGGSATTDYLVFRRNLGSSGNALGPSEKIIFDPKYYIWARKTFGQSNYSWSEVSP
ncbi:MAG: hypothetical protein A3J50_03860 [Candidatus Woykebacteria bacterium RIFCSPHIGHO2_02_FULL_43_16b]|uniref:Uncharacterized protein n=1 Tax=Candidatus Woykebacteria bacterium RIFCSPHIGHO2_02_FULL_43_16b TaxID=1802601 RepID=A0A1G1WP77_9BACT|nr:MAG: hypothetical protein A3J50_03860 [Candidatus Woykebacteria bacterium RIFCSPHIGHO2_02_FULL_43_16b]